MPELLRRDFLKQLASTTGAVVLIPSVTACGGSPPSGSTTLPIVESNPTAPVIPPIPATEPDAWDPIAFNRDRGNAGAIPESYHESINGEEGVNGHLGKHLPYIPDTAGLEVPAGYVAIMYGDPSRGHAKHPNAERNESNNHEGHWYNWIRIRAASDPQAEELESTYADWPGVEPSDNGAYAVLGEGDIRDESGKNTIYLAALPAGVQTGDRVRLYAHCLTHGEYVDFITVA